MTTITVFHSRMDLADEMTRDVLTPRAGDLTPIAERFAAGWYEPVAEFSMSGIGLSLEAKLEAVWRLTNNVGNSWSRDVVAGKTMLAPATIRTVDGRQLGRRSSMAGDIFIADGKRYVVASFGFDDLMKIETDYGKWIDAQSAIVQNGIDELARKGAPSVTVHVMPSRGPCPGRLIAANEAAGGRFDPPEDALRILPTPTGGTNFGFVPRSALRSMFWHSLRSDPVLPSE